MKYILMYIGLMMGLLVCGCDPMQTERIQSQSVTVVVDGIASSATLNKASYDGHDYIILGIDRGGSIIHHPDCKCKSNMK